MAAIIRERLKKYSPKTREEEGVALKEILQEIILCALSDAGFFKEAIFQGGTSLRIFHNLPRFSEVLDFILKTPNSHFKWRPFLQAIEDTCKQYGITPEIIDKSKSDNLVKKMILKDNSIVKILNLSLDRDQKQKLTIKLEIDADPPTGSGSQLRFLDFPLATEVEVQDLPSNFAGKIHALLCREYVKGRDWYDFLWSVANEVTLNFVFLSNAINQQGPWENQAITVDSNWCLAAVKEKIDNLDWEKVKNDVYPFLNEQDRKKLSLWGAPFFLDRFTKLKNTLNTQFTMDEPIEFLAGLEISDEQKRLIRSFLDYFVRSGHKIDRCKVAWDSPSSLSNTKIYIYTKEGQYQIHIGKAVFKDKILEQELHKAKTTENLRILLNTGFIKIGRPESFIPIN